jgi:hypothetical protein
MPKNIIGNSPFAIRTIDTDDPVDAQSLQAAIGERSGVSLCIRSANGPVQRGGYFLHVRREGDLFAILDFEGHRLDSLPIDSIVRLANHVSGRRFDQEMLAYCASVINLRQDEIAGEQDA